VSPSTSIDTRSSAAAEPEARANGATPVFRVTEKGPSTRTFVKLVIPKLRVAAPAGAAMARNGTARRKMRMRRTFRDRG
jgi:hypothetical protein